MVWSSMSPEEDLVGNILVGNKHGGADHNNINGPCPVPLWAVRCPNFALAMRPIKCAQFDRTTPWGYGSCLLLYPQGESFQGQLSSYPHVDNSSHPLDQASMVECQNRTCPKSLRRPNAQGLKDNMNLARDLLCRACKTATRDSVDPLIDADGVVRTLPEDMNRVLKSSFC